MCALESRKQCEADNCREEKEYQFVVFVAGANAWLLQA